MAEASLSPIKERIYIGGLNPPQLSGVDVFNRLKSIEKIEIESADTKKKDHYLHVSAVCLDAGDSALSIISRMYHNVKWKGCKLVVEAAKPHFLEVLEKERTQKIDAMAGSNIDLSTSEERRRKTSQKENDQIPRRLRIRKKYGDTAVHVDTKPWTVDSWHYFNRARSKLQERAEKRSIKSDSSKDVELAVFSLTHRAVHIRFSEDESPESHQNSIGTAQSLSSNDSDSTNENKDYEWSDDESDSSSDSDHSITDYKITAANEPYFKSSRNNILVPSENIAGADQFEDKPVGENELAVTSEKSCDNGEWDLVSDVSKNLNILSSIFPGMEKPKLVTPGTNLRTSTSESVMPRYDPRIVTSEKYLLMSTEHQESNINPSKSNKVSYQDTSQENGLVDKNCDKLTENNLTEYSSTEDIEDIYEQDKLEDVFRDARDVWEGQQTRSTLYNSTKGSSDFSFAFNLDDGNHVSSQKLIKSNPTRDAFSFSFDNLDPSQLDSNAKDSPSNKNLEDANYRHDSTAFIVAKNTTKVPPRFRGLNQPEQDIQSFVDNFFSCNSGFRTTHDVDSFRGNDHKGREEWNRERLTLTLDWKRKRKYAVTRIHKRIKIGKR